jgi:hypothetical protein
MPVIAQTLLVFVGTFLTMMLLLQWLDGLSH